MIMSFEKENLSGKLCKMNEKITTENLTDENLTILGYSGDKKYMKTRKRVANICCLSSSYTMIVEYQCLEIYYNNVMIFAHSIFFLKTSSHIC